MTTPHRILCVDDEENILKAIRRTFMDDDYEIMTCLSGEEGLRELEKTEGIGVVVSDYRMPGMNGVEFLSEVCRRWPGTVRMVLSGYADTAAIISAINLGQIYQFIPKPWEDEELRAAVSRAVSLYASQKAAEPSVEEMVPPVRYRELLDAIPLPIFCSDAGGAISYANREGFSLAGGAATKFPEVRAKVRVLLQDDARATVEFGGRRRTAKAIPLNDGEGKRAGTLLLLSTVDDDD